MSEPPQRTDTGVLREALIIATLTAIGAMLRLWSLGRLGLVHFDEGIYAMAGLWVFSPKGVGELESVIAYAPPGFPFLVGLSYSLLGVSDVSAILVSILAGTLTIPAIGWLAYRSFGPGAGAAAAAFAALSGPHIAFSRMALTDTSFLLSWILAIGMGQRFLERPGFSRAATLGLAVGVAQLFKYNGWIAGVMVALSAASWAVLHPDERAARNQFALWGWGLLAAMVATVVYWPWFRFVESHGGYAALLAHHGSYLGGISSWPGHAIVQLEQDRALSGGIRWLTFGGLVGAISLQVALGALRPGSRSRARDLVVALSLPALGTFILGAGFGALIWMTAFGSSGMRSATKAAFVLGVGWAAMAVLTPFYHPYARLLLPFQAFSALLLAGAFGILRDNLERLGAIDRRSMWGVSGRLLCLAAGLWIGPLLFAFLSTYWNTARGISEVLEPSDSLRTACRTIASDLPKDLNALRVYARPPVTFYLSGTAPVSPRPTLDLLIEHGDPNTWALLDDAMVRQGAGVKGRVAEANNHWGLVREVPTTLNVPTLLDIDPSAAVRAKPGRSAPLLLFRPKTSGAVR
jgi:4-amino-4-deoxy-L-arabinose transferase-like glycosyltransferase